VEGNGGKEGRDRKGGREERRKGKRVIRRKESGWEVAHQPQIAGFLALFSVLLLSLF